MKLRAPIRGSKFLKEDKSFCPYCGAEIWYEVSRLQAYFYAVFLVPLVGVAYEYEAWKRGYEGMPTAVRVLIFLSLCVAAYLYPKMRQSQGRWVEVADDRRGIERKDLIYTAIAVAVLVLFVWAAVWFIEAHRCCR